MLSNKPATKAPFFVHSSEPYALQRYINFIVGIVSCLLPPPLDKDLNDDNSSNIQYLPWLCHKYLLNL